MYSELLLLLFHYLCTHLYVGVGFPSATHSKTAGVNNGAVVRRSGPADKILGGSAGH